MRTLRARLSLKPPARLASYSPIYCASATCARAKSASTARAEAPADERERRRGIGSIEFAVEGRREVEDARAGVPRRVPQRPVQESAALGREERKPLLSNSSAESIARFAEFPTVLTDFSLANQDHGN